MTLEERLRLSPQRLGLVRGRVPHLTNTVFRAGFGIYTNQASYSVLQKFLLRTRRSFLVKTVANPSKPLYDTEKIFLSFNPTQEPSAPTV